MNAMPYTEQREKHHTYLEQSIYPVSIEYTCNNYFAMQFSM